VELSSISSYSEGSSHHQAESRNVKRAIEDALLFNCGMSRDLARVTRSVFSELHGKYVVTVEVAGEKYHRWLMGPHEAETVAEGVMQDYGDRHPEVLAQGP
jgi:hypothetical protein